MDATPAPTANTDATSPRRGLRGFADAFGKVWHAPTVREAILAIPVGASRTLGAAFVVAWLVIPIGGALLGRPLGIGVGYLVDVDRLAVLAAIGLLGGSALRARLAGRDAGVAVWGTERAPLVWFAVFLGLGLVSTLLKTPGALFSPPSGFRGESWLTYVGYVAIFVMAARVTARQRKVVVYTALSVVLVTVLTSFVIANPAIEREWNPFVVTTYWPTALYNQFNHYGYVLATGIGMFGAAAVCMWSAAVNRRRRAPVSAHWPALTESLGVPSSVASGVGIALAFVVVVWELNRNHTLGAFVAAGCALAVAAVWLVTTGERKKTLLAVGVLMLFVTTSVIAGLFHLGFAADLVGLGKDVVSVATADPEAARAGTGRWGLWVETMRHIVANPWLGTGTEGVNQFLLDVGGGRTHNEYLQYAAFYGIPALFAYVAAIVTVFRRAWLRGRTLPAGAWIGAIGALAYCVSAFFGLSLFNTAPWLFITLGLTWSGIVESDNSSPETAKDTPRETYGTVG